MQDPAPHPHDLPPSPSPAAEAQPWRHDEPLPHHPSPFRRDGFVADGKVLDAGDRAGLVRHLAKSPWIPGVYVPDADEDYGRRHAVAAHPAVRDVRDRGRGVGPAGRMRRLAASPSFFSGMLPRLAFACVCAAPVLLPGGAGAQVEVVIDNDVLGLRGADAPPPDYEYTHGLSVGWDARSRRDVACHAARWEVGQRIYTPRRDAAEPVPGERPYAGWLYGAWERTASSPRTRSRLRVEAGVTGPPSLAEPVQNAIHRLAGYQRQLGWRHQLGFEPGLVVSYGRESRIVAIGATSGTRLEVVPAWTMRAGNVRTGAEAGVRARLGFGAGEGWMGAGAARGVSGWIEAAGRQEAVLRDLFIDGNTFAGPGPGLERRTWVAQGEAAFGIRWRRTEVEYRHLLRGREYATQAEPHPWGSIRVRVHP